MSHQLFLTDLGKQKLASLATTGQGNPLVITEFVVGAGKDVDFSKRLDRQTLVAKKYQAKVQGIVQIAPNQYEISCVIPADIGGFSIREVGLLAGDILMWVGSLPEVQKPTVENLSAVDYRIKCIISLDNHPNIELNVDGNVITATRTWVEEKLTQLLVAKMTAMQAEIESLKSRPIIPIGGLFATTKDYANGEAVTAELGYGKWVRALIGRTGVGYDPNASDWTGTMGKKYGANEHTLTIDEMPSHTHSAKYRNLQVKEGEYDGVAYPLSINAGQSKYTENQTDYPIGIKGGSQPHNNVQKSEIIAYWERLPDDYVPPVYRVYWTSDKEGNNQTRQINEGQKAFLWTEVANLTTPQTIGAVLDGANHDSISIAGGRFDFPETIDNGKTKLGEFAPTAINKDITISMGISLPNDEQVVSRLTVKNDIANDWDVEMIFNTRLRQISINDLLLGTYKNHLKTESPYYALLDTGAIFPKEWEWSSPASGLIAEFTNLDYYHYNSKLEINFLKKQHGSHITREERLNYQKQYADLHDYVVYDEQGQDITKYTKKTGKASGYHDRDVVYREATALDSLFPSLHYFDIEFDKDAMQDNNINQEQVFTIKVRNNDPWWRNLRGI